MSDDLVSPFMGLFSRWGAVARRPHDPDVSCWAGLLPRWGARAHGESEIDARGDLAVGGAAWTAEGAEAAALGEAVERWRPGPSPCDEIVEGSFAGWRADEEAIAPGRWVLFSREQHEQPGFPFAPLSERTVCRWVCCRDAVTGRAAWAPAALVYLDPLTPPAPLSPLWERGEQGGASGSPSPLVGEGAGVRGGLAPTISTGLSAGRPGDPVLLRGAQEVIERDALVGAWWGRYPLEEFDPARVWRSLPADVGPRVLRPNLRWRFFRIDTPSSAHVTIATLSGDDHEGFCFSAGSACRSTRRESWSKSILEAVQGRHYARYLRRTRLAALLKGGEPDSFAGHALYYSLHPERLRQTPLDSARTADGDDPSRETFPMLGERLGADRPILFRLMTPPGLERRWVVARVLIPGAQPLHGHHRFPFLGGPLWGDRRLAEWSGVPPHPFP